MLQKIKDFVSSVSYNMVAILSLAVGILLYFLSRRKKEVNSLRAKIDLIETQKQADLIEVEIKKRIDSKECLAEEVRQLELSLEILEQRRKEIAESQKNKNSSDIEDFWRNN